MLFAGRGQLMEVDPGASERASRELPAAATEVALF